MVTGKDSVAIGVAPGYEFVLLLHCGEMSLQGVGKGQFNKRAPSKGRANFRLGSKLKCEM